jgi:hypothetical protein
MESKPEKQQSNVLQIINNSSEFSQYESGLTVQSTVKNKAMVTQDRKTSKIAIELLIICKTLLCGFSGLLFSIFQAD